ncbi:MAG TPA: hypothetical protein VIM19_06800 [Actinomycetes bacterium]
MDFPAQLDNLQKRASETATTARAATEEDRAQLKQRIDKAQVDMNLAMKDTQQQSAAAADRAQGKWAQMKADAASKVDDFNAKAAKRADQMDAKIAEADAKWAEADAEDAIDYAAWAIDNARLAVLNALDARAQADSLARVAGP